MQLLEEIETEVDEEKQWRRGFKNTTGQQQDDVQYEQDEGEEAEEEEEEDAEADALSEMLV